MKLLCYSAKGFEVHALQDADNKMHQVHFTAESLSIHTTGLAEGFEAVSIFAGDDASPPVIKALKDAGIKYIAIRAAGYDNVSLETAAVEGIRVANVPAYSPYAIAEHSIGLLLALNRKLIPADRQVHQHNFTVDNLFGFDLHQKNVGIIGTGKIGSVAAKIFHGFGCNIVAHDICENSELARKYNIRYVPLDELCACSDIISLHICLTAGTRHLINRNNIRLMNSNVVLINTARGAVVNTADVIEALEQGRISAFGTDVYENEKGLFFYDHSRQELADPLLLRLLQLPNVLVTPHQAFATREALANITTTTIANLDSWERGERSPNELRPGDHC